MLYDIHPLIFIFQDKRHPQVAQGVKRSNHRWLVAVHKIGVQDDSLETEVRSARSGVEPIDLQQVLQGPSVLLVPIVLRYRMSFSSDLFTQLQLWHLHWLGQSTGEQYSQPQVVFHFASHGRNAGIVRTRPRLGDLNPRNVTCIPMHQQHLDYYRHQRLKACRSIHCVSTPWSFDHNWALICTILLSTPNNALCHRDKKLLWNVLTIWQWQISRKS
jgi:hypothetical protein